MQTRAEEIGGEENDEKKGEEKRKKRRSEEIKTFCSGRSGERREEWREAS